MSVWLKFRPPVDLFLSFSAYYLFPLVIVPFFFFGKWPCCMPVAELSVTWPNQHEAGRGGEGRRGDLTWDFTTWAEMLRGTWSVELTRERALLTEAGVWVLYGHPWFFPRPCCSPLFLPLLQALPSMPPIKSFLAQVTWGSISITYNPRTWNDMQSLSLFLIGKKKWSGSVEIYQILTRKPAHQLSLYLSVFAILEAQWITANLESKLLLVCWRELCLLRRSFKICDADECMGIRSGKNMFMGWLWFGHIKMGASKYQNIFSIS